MLSAVEKSRLNLLKTTDAKTKSRLGQFFTPEGTARFMAKMFSGTRLEVCRLLDAGAGIGSLSTAFLERCANGEFDFRKIELDAFEIDAGLHPVLKNTLESHLPSLPLELDIKSDDFIETAVASLTRSLFTGAGQKYSHAILNPPYKKIGSNSRHRLLLRRAGIETVNLYSAFVALALSLLDHAGELVAIIPRSFCNGPYYRPFRECILKRGSICHIHLFDARNKAFSDEGVLQENVIVKIVRGIPQGEVTVTTSTDDTFDDLKSIVYDFEQIVLPGDPQNFIHIPTSRQKNHFDESTIFQHSLADIGISISTGPVVDFRLKDHLRQMPESGCVPLLYPCHFTGQATDWPKSSSKKPNAIRRNAKTEKWLYPNGYYCVVRRFSAKEEKRRIIASIVEPSCFPHAERLGFENHLNVFHENKQGLPESLARGLSVFLNSTIVDEYFRRFNGHTQVNALDLRRMKYPDRATLMRLGERAMNSDDLSQAEIDSQLDVLTHVHES